jgi:hypothetical protein
MRVRMGAQQVTISRLLRCSLANGGCNVQSRSYANVSLLCFEFGPSTVPPMAYYSMAIAVAGFKLPLPGNAQEVAIEGRI